VLLDKMPDSLPTSVSSFQELYHRFFSHRVHCDYTQAVALNVTSAGKRISFVANKALDPVKPFREDIVYRTGQPLGEWIYRIF
jgi:hypothetical protein